jgi:hypothetical protein
VKRTIQQGGRSITGNLGREQGRGINLKKYYEDITNTEIYCIKISCVVLL